MSAAQQSIKARQPSTHAGQAQPYVSEGAAGPNETARKKRCFAAAKEKNPAASQESYLIRCLAAWHQIICSLQPISFAPIPAKLGATAAWKPEYGRYPYCGVFSIVLLCVLFFFPSRPPGCGSCYCLQKIRRPAWVTPSTRAPRGARRPGWFERPRFGIAIHGRMTLLIKIRSSVTIYCAIGSSMLAISAALGRLKCTCEPTDLDSLRTQK